MAFLVFEGVDGSGKSTLLNFFSEELKKRLCHIICTREPGGSSKGKKMREMLLERQDPALDPLVEVLLYYADRKQNIEETIKPALKKGFWVLSDRYWASTFAYQCGGRGIEEKFIDTLRQKLCSDCEPDLWILLDLPVETSLKRLALRKGHLNHFDKENQSFHQKVRHSYLYLAKKHASKWLVLNAEKPLSSLVKELFIHLQKKGFLKDF